MAIGNYESFEIKSRKKIKKNDCPFHPIYLCLNFFCFLKKIALEPPCLSINRDKFYVIINIHFNLATNDILLYDSFATHV